MKVYVDLNVDPEIGESPTAVKDRVQRILDGVGLDVELIGVDVDESHDEHHELYLATALT